MFLPESLLVLRNPNSQAFTIIIIIIIIAIASLTGIGQRLDAETTRFITPAFWLALLILETDD